VKKNKWLPPVICFILLISISGCSKKYQADMRSPEEIRLAQLTGLGEKRWFLKSIFVNGVALSAEELPKGFFKTYTRSENATVIFSDADGNKGKAYLLSTTRLQELITNGPIANLTRIYTVLELTENSLHIETTSLPGRPLQTVREIYHAN